MAKFSLKGSSEYYLNLSEQPKRFEADSPVTNVFFDDTNGEVFTVRSGGVTGITVTGMDESQSTSFRMDDRGPIISIKFSPDHKILAIQRNQDNQNACVEFVNFKDMAPTNVEYTQSCKWKNAKILGFVWPKVNEIAFITDHGIELLQVIPEKKQLKSLKNTSFSGAWYSWCAPSNIVLLAGNNGALLQPFSLNNSSVTKLQKLELDSAKPVAERDVFILRLCEAAWCAVFRHGTSAAVSSPGPTEVWLMPISGASNSQYTHVLKTGLVGRFAVNVVDDLVVVHHQRQMLGIINKDIQSNTQYTHVLKTGLVGRFAVNVVDDLVVVHHQSSQTSLLFDIMEESKPENNTVVHIPIVPGSCMRPAFVEDQFAPMYSVNWVVFQPDFIVDARLGCLWRVQLNLPGLAHSIPKEEISKIVAVLLRRTDGKAAIYSILGQLVGEASKYLVEVSKVFDEINSVYRKWADQEVARNTAGVGAGGAADRPPVHYRVLISQPDMCGHVLLHHSDDDCALQVVTAYIASLSRHDMVVQHPVAELAVRTLVTRGAIGRLKSLVRRGCLGDARPLACQLLSLGHLQPAAAQLALDMMWRLKAYEEIVEVLLSWNEPISAIGAAKQAGAHVWHSLPARKLLAAAKLHAEKANDPGAFAATYHALRERNDKLRSIKKLLAAAKLHAEKANDPGAFAATYHALRERNDKLRGAPHFTKNEQCDVYVEYYKQITSE
ncbi:colon cancer-associated protein mic1-like domain-containing protein [Phthorimaea operculella]|nr:colon cancer-associated protein mic1-like domain-containing protein [Phthorimaea operculella]